MKRQKIRKVDAMVDRESMVHSECILCGTCVDGCPEHAIQFSIRKGH